MCFCSLFEKHNILLQQNVIAKQNPKSSSFFANSTYGLRVQEGKTHSNEENDKSPGDDIRINIQNIYVSTKYINENTLCI